MQLRNLIVKVLADVSRTHLECTFPEEVADGVSFTELGFDSVAYVATISALEEELGCIPKSIIEDARFPATVGELITAYQSACAADRGGSNGGSGGGGRSEAAVTAVL